MRSTIRHTTALLLLGAAFAGVSCSSPATDASSPGAGATASTTTVADSTVDAASLGRPAALSSLPELSLVAPGSTDAGEVPVFTWEAVDGAATYRLAVIEQDGPLWAWVGDGTEVRLGGLEVEPPAGFGGPRLTAGAYWSVVALDDADRAVAASGLRPVSPDGELPAWTPEDVADRPAQAEVVEDPAPPTGPLVACDLLTGEEVGTFLGKSAGPGIHSNQGDHYSVCEWAHAEDEQTSLDVSVNRKDGAWNPTMWAGEDYTPIEGLGDDSFAFSDWVGTRVGFVRDGVVVYLTSGYGESAQPPMIDLARLADARLEDAG